MNPREINLLEKSVESQCPIAKKTSRLSEAAGKGDIEIVRELLAEKANINGKSGFYGYTALHSAIVHKKEEILQLLLEAKANPNIKDNNGHNPLQLALSRSNPATMITKLITAGTEVDVKPNKNGISPLDRYLTKYTTDPHITDTQLDEALSIINIMLGRGEFLKYEYRLYSFLLTCNQNNPDVLGSLTKLCQYVKESWVDNIERIGRKELLDLAPKYLNKLQVVLLSKDREILLERDLNTSLAADSVEKLYERICQKKYPFWSKFPFLGVPVDVKPEDLSKQNLKSLAPI